MQAVAGRGTACTELQNRCEYVLYSQSLRGGTLGEKAAESRRMSLRDLPVEHQPVAIRS